MYMHVESEIGNLKIINIHKQPICVGSGCHTQK